MENTTKLLSDITVYGKYARYLPEAKRRENWSEIVQRNADMHVKKYPQLADEIYKAYANYVLPHKVHPSMRSLQFAGKAIEQSPARLFNCAFSPIDNTRAFSEAMFLLLGGSGVGVSVQRDHINKLPSLKGPKDRERRFLINDSIEGWAQSIDVLIESYFHNKMSVKFDYSDIRPKGAYLVTAGGKAPGPQPLKDAIHNIQKVLDGALADRYVEGGDVFITPIEAFDIVCHISDAVLAGGIRRSAIITVFDNDNLNMLHSKHISKLEANPQRHRSNNSAVIYRNDPDYDYADFSELWEHIVKGGTGEPGVVFSNSLEYSVNPCVEISLRSNSFCNLTEITDEPDMTQEEFEDRVRVASFIGTLQASYTDFHFLRDVWRETTEEDALIGVSITGIGGGNTENLDLKKASQVVIDENKRVAGLLKINSAKRTTAIKPSGTSSLVAGVSSGIHPWHNDYYIRRMRLNKGEALYTYLKETLPEEFIEDEYFDPNGTGVLSIPVKAPEGAHLRSEPMMSSLARVRKFNTEWVAGGHVEGENKNNVSVTVSVKENEWDILRDWMWANRDTFTGMSVLPYDGSTAYPQMPFEDITREKYEELTALLVGIEFNADEIIENDDNTDLKGEVACAGGKCDV